MSSKLAGSLVVCGFIGGLIGAATYRVQVLAAPKTIANAEIIQRLSQYSIPIQIEGHTVGSGVLVELPSGVSAVITNDHVCQVTNLLHKPLNLTYAGQPIWDPVIRVSNPDRDLCVITSQALLHEPALRIGTNKNTRFGDQLLVIGYPLGGPMTPEIGFYIGLAELQIAAPTRPDGTCDRGSLLRTPFTDYCISHEKLFQTTVVIYPGNSGSPVFNSDGELVGIMNSADNETHKGNYISSDALRNLVKGM